MALRLDELKFASDPIHTDCVCLAHLAFGLRSDERDQVSYVRDYLVDEKSSVGPREKFQIDAIYNDKIFNHLNGELTSGRHASQVKETFRDTWNTEWDIGGVAIFRNMASSPHYIVDLGGRKVCILPTNCTEVWHSMRMMRETYLREMQSAGHVTVHAGAVQIESHGVLIVGPKGAGKTTLIGMLLDAGSIYVSNDRVLVNEIGGVVLAHTFPIAINVSPLSIRGDAQPRFDRIKLSRYQLQTGASVRRAAVRESRKIELSLREWLYVHRSKAAPKATVDAVVVPQWDPHRRDTLFEKMTEAEMVATLLGQQYVMGDPSYLAPWVHRPRIDLERAQAHAEHVTDTLARNTVGLRIIYGRGRAAESMAIREQIQDYIVRARNDG